MQWIQRTDNDESSLTNTPTKVGPKATAASWRRKTKSLKQHRWKNRWSLEQKRYLGAKVGPKYMKLAICSQARKFY
jgi:hypothetical protein